MIFWMGSFSPFDHETLAVTNAVKVLTAAKYTVACNDIRALITIETDQIRYWPDGTDPSSTVGHVANAGDSMVLENMDQLKKFKCIRITADATLSVTYYKR